VYLKSLELQGFKSFPDKTKLTFEGGATVIVGPNGSGKSNISDAMRWVLGEVSSKSIRGTKMEDIIFGGADSRRPMGYAEVSVTFDNSGMLGRLDCPYDEVTVTRRYYRSGESEYFINRRACRLKDIYEMFMNTGVGRDGYSIIGQGKIAEIVSKKSDERRSIFEDASGIAKYRHKKSETERKLASTEDNMTRINDVFQEVAAQVGPLEKEAGKAKRALELLEVKKQVDVQLWLYDTDKLREDIAKCEESFKHAEFDLHTAEDSIRALEAQNDRLFEISQSNKTESEKLLGEIRARTDENHAIDSEYRVIETNILHSGELIAGAKGTCESTQKSINAEQDATRARLERIEAIKVEQAKKNEMYAAAEAEKNTALKEAQSLGFDIDRALSDIHTITAEIADVNARISFIDNSRNTETDKNTAMQNEIAEYEAQSEKLEKQISTIKNTVDEYDAVTAKTSSAADKLTGELADLYGKRHEDNDEMSALVLRRDSARQRIDTFKAMEEQFEGYAGSVRFVMKKYAEKGITDKHGVPCGKIYGPLSKLISVEDRYLNAIETALGPNLQHIVVEDESVAKSAMFALKKADAGRATFFPLTSMKGQTVTPEMRDAAGYAGYIAVADELVESESKFSQILSGLLGRTVVFDTIENATVMARDLRYKVKVVTLDGQQINVGGSFTGGSVKHKGNILGRAGEIKRLEEEAEALDGKIAKLNASLSELAKRIEDCENEKDECEQKMSLIKVMRDSEAARLEQLSAKLDANKTLTEKLYEDFEAQKKAREQFEVDREILCARRKELELRSAEISAARAEMDIKRSAALDKKDECDRAMTEIFIGISELRKDIETEERMIEEANVRMEGYADLIASQEAYISELEQKIAELEAQKQTNRVRYDEGEKELSELNAKRAKVEEGAGEFERKLGEVNAKMREKMQYKENVFKEYTRFENRLANLRAEQDKLATKLWDEHELTRADAVQLGYPTIDASTRAEAAAKQTECRNKLRAIGNVDLDAVNKYKEIKSRYDYMEGQIKDLGAARDDLLDIIGKLEGEMETAFIDSFNQINENFNRVFGELFGGGSAQLSLTDPENVLESGIEIKAAPPGKIIKNMVQLSGGEQSFIAIALFFAILQVNPTPFCILDEIEAALDEVNVARFAEYIKRYSSGTQFIMITHRRGTMEAANRLYGVTMPERGISKVLELNIEDISKKKGDDWDGILG
jgi:chromosome segregation protein